MRSGDITMAFLNVSWRSACFIDEASPPPLGGGVEQSFLSWDYSQVGDYQDF